MVENAANLISGSWFIKKLWYGLPSCVYTMQIIGQTSGEVIANVAHNMKSGGTYTEERLADIGFYNDTRKPYDEPPEYNAETQHLEGSVIDGRVVFVVVDNV